MWLETVADEHLEDDVVEFLRNFVSILGLIDDFIVEAMVLRINE